MNEIGFEYRPAPLPWFRSKWCARMHRRHTSMGYDDGGKDGEPTATALCRKCGRLVVISCASPGGELGPTEGPKSAAYSGYGERQKIDAPPASTPRKSHDIQTEVDGGQR